MEDLVNILLKNGKIEFAKKVKEILLDKKTFDRGIYNRKNLEKFLNYDNKDSDPYDFNGKKIWMILNVELWMRNKLVQ